MPCGEYPAADALRRLFINRPGGGGGGGLQLTGSQLCGNWAGVPCAAVTDASPISPGDAGCAAIPARFSFRSLSVGCASVGASFSWTFRAGSAILPPDRQSRAAGCPGIPSAVRGCLDRIADPTVTQGIGLSGCLVSGPAVLSPGIPSPRRFDRRACGGGAPGMARNLRSPFGVARAPSGTWMRGRPGGAGPRGLRRRLTKVHAPPRRGRVLEGWTVPGDNLPVPVGGAGHHSSHSASCRNRRSGPGTHHHRALGAAAVHPDIGEAPPPGTGCRPTGRTSGRVSGKGFPPHAPPAVARGPPPDGASLNLKASMPGYGEHPCFGSSPDPGFPGGKGEIRRFPRVTGLPPGRDTVMSVMRRGRPGAAAPEARPLPVEQAARPVPDLRHPGLAGPVYRHVRADGETRTLRNTPRRTVAAPTTPCADTRFPEPCSRPAIRRAHPEPAAHAARQKQLPACRQIS